MILETRDFAAVPGGIMGNVQSNPFDFRGF